MAKLGAHIIELKVMCTNNIFTNELLCSKNLMGATKTFRRVSNENEVCKPGVGFKDLASG